MFGNVEVSKDFEEFLDFLGSRVALNGFTGYAAGLDTKRKVVYLHY
jgi:hypothetical protein